MLMLLFHGLESGVYNFTGEMFCPNYNFNYVTGSFGAALFALETSANIFLAIDRCCDFISPKICEFLFNGILNTCTYLSFIVLILRKTYYFLDRVFNHIFFLLFLLCKSCILQWCLYELVHESVRNILKFKLIF
ncbi:unnamed protein product [Meloidogyne enterolobii]|uniref:Uncharacterized protein n=1 Tax=Meloidogyne enterolobii TaxID=390850 RepID=A0ACB0YBR3_MELEN